MKNSLKSIRVVWRIVFSLIFFCFHCKKIFKQYTIHVEVEGSGRWIFSRVNASRVSNCLSQKEDYKHLIQIPHIITTKKQKNPPHNIIRTIYLYPHGPHNEFLIYDPPPCRRATRRRINGTFSSSSCFQQKPVEYVIPRRLISVVLVFLSILKMAT